MSVVSFALAVVFIIRLFSTSAFRVPNGQTVYNMGTFAEKWVNIWSVQARNHGGKRAIGAPEISENMIRF